LAGPKGTALSMTRWTTELGREWFVEHVGAWRFGAGGGAVDAD